MVRNRAEPIIGPGYGGARGRPLAEKNKLANCTPSTLSFSPRSSNWSGTTKCSATELRNWPRTLFGSNRADSPDGPHQPETRSIRINIIEEQVHHDPEPNLTVSRGHGAPFGATVRPGGVSFAVFARHAERVHLVLSRRGHERWVAEIP